MKVSDTMKGICKSYNCNQGKKSQTFILYFCFLFILLNHEESHREVYREFQPSYDIFLRSGAERVIQTTGSLHGTPAYTAQLLTLHQHRATNQYRTANQIKPTLRVSSNTQGTLEQSPIQVLTELDVDWLQRLYKNWSFQVDKPLCPLRILFRTLQVLSVWTKFKTNICIWHNETYTVRFQKTCSAVQGELLHNCFVHTQYRQQLFFAAR